VIAMLAGAIAGALLLKASVFAPLALAAVLAITTWLAYIPAAGPPGQRRALRAPRVGASALTGATGAPRRQPSQVPANSRRSP